MFYLPAGRGTLSQVNMADEYKTESQNKSFLSASFSLAFYHRDEKVTNKPTILLSS